MIFWLIITAFLILSLAIVLGPYWRKTDLKTPDRTDLNVRLYKDRLAELETDLKNKALDKDQYRQAVSELKLQLLSDVPENLENRPDAPRRPFKTIMLMVLLVPALSIGLYALLGNMDVATGKVDVTSRQDALEIQKMISAFAQRLEANPDDVRGWVLLGRSYAVIEQMDNAVNAYERAYALAPNDPEVLTGLAETLAMSNSNQLHGRSVELLQQVLTIDPNNLRALWLIGYAQVQMGNNEQAVKYWQTLLALLPPDDEEVQIVRKYITQFGGSTDVAAESTVAEDSQKSVGDSTNEAGEE